MTLPDPTTNTSYFRRAALHLFVFFFGAYALLFHGLPISRDEQLLAAAGRSLLHLSLRLEHPVFGQTASEYGIGLPLVALPLAALDEVVTRSGGRSAESAPSLIFLSNALITALLICAFFCFCRWLSCPLEESILTALLLGLTTQLMPYSGTFFTEPLTTLWLFIGFMCLWKGAGERRGAVFLAAGVALAGAVLTRVSSLIYVPLYVGYALSASPSNDLRRSLSWGEAGFRSATLLVPIAAAAGLQLALNAHLRGSVLDMGYSGSDWTTGYGTGIWGLLFSPGRGLFIYNPLVLITLLSAPVFFRRHASVGAFIAVFCVITLVFHARFWTWHAGWTPGTRFLLPVLPFLFLGLPDGLNKWGWCFSDGVAVRLGRLGFWVLALTGFVVQAAHVLVNPLDANNELFGLLWRQENSFLFVPQYSSLTGVWRLIGDGQWRWWAWVGGNEWFAAVNGGGAVLVVLSMKRLIGPFLRIWFWPVVQDLWALLRTPAVGVGVVALAVVCVAAVWGKGPRGVRLTQFYPTSDFDTVESVETVSGEFGRWRLTTHGRAPLRIEWSGYLQAPLTGVCNFFAKARGAYAFKVGEQVLFSNDDPALPQHLQSGKIELERGRMYPFRGYFVPFEKEESVFYLYWTLPGEGVALAPVSSEYLFPELPGKTALVWTAIWRKSWLIALVFLGPVLFFSHPLRPLPALNGNSHQNG